jgi:Carboxypeptidase regulatory-like domain
VCSGVLLAIAAAFLTAAPAFSADLSLPVTGNLLGAVEDSAGIPQIGATVQLFNKYERVVAKTLTTADGRFGFAGLPADFYSVRVSLPSFLPASRDRVPVKAGLDSVLQIHLATLFSNIEVTYVTPSAAMMDDWKWVLRTSAATRPVNRIFEAELPSASKDPSRPHIFSETRAMLSLNGGDGGLVDSGSLQNDVGTGFALSTNILGKNQLQVAGSLGDTTHLSAAPMSLGVIYSRNSESGFGRPPEVTLTISQLGRLGPQVSGAQSLPTGAVLNGDAVIRTMSLSLYQVLDPSENVHLEYGVSGQSIDYLQHTGRISPFARLTTDLGKVGEVLAAYSDGSRPDELVAHSERASDLDIEADHDSDLARTANALGLIPQLSTRNGRLHLQRTGNYEVGFKKATRSTTFAASAFREHVVNGRISVAGDLSPLDSSNLLSDGISNTSTLNIGAYQRQGFIASVDQRVSASLDLALAYGRMGGFSGNVAGLESNSTQSFLAQGNHNVAAVNVRSHLPLLKTQIAADYGWIDNGTVIPSHVFLTQRASLTPGLNICFRQPLPSVFGMPGRLEFTADLRNLLAQGYLPFETAGGQRLLVVQAPRAIRGGLNFIF